MKTRKCPECNINIIGRSDKKFCSDQCRNNYNNDLRKDVLPIIRDINKVLKKNRDILFSLNPKGKTKVSKLKLSSCGFNFVYYTNRYQTKNKNTYYFCYDQGYIDLGEDYYGLVVKQDYV